MGETDARLLNGPPIRDAATIIVVRDPGTRPRVLMGQRGTSASFMPSKFVFPGGAVDPADAAVPLTRSVPDPCRNRLDRPDEASPEALAAAAIRELWEETGQILGRPAPWSDAPHDWQGFAATGHRPDPSHLSYVFRAVTPPGQTRRFDARFFLVDAAHLASDPDDFSTACDELSHLQWVTLAEARTLDLPFITAVVLGEIEAHLPRTDAPQRVPFFRNDAAWRVIDDAKPAG